MLEWIIYLYNNEGKKEPLSGGQVHESLWAYAEARDTLKGEMQEGPLFLWDKIELVIDGVVYYEGTIGNFSRETQFDGLGW